MLVTIYLYIIRNYIIELYNIYSCLRFSSSLSYWCELTADFRRKRVRSERAASQLFGRVAAENGGWQLCLQRVWCLVGTTEHGALSESGLGEPQGFWYSRSAFALIFLQLMRSSKDQNVSSWNIVPRLWKPLWSFPGKLNSIILGAYLALKRLQPYKPPIAVGFGTYNGDRDCDACCPSKVKRMAFQQFSSPFFRHNRKDIVRNWDCALVLEVLTEKTWAASGLNQLTRVYTCHLLSYFIPIMGSWRCWQALVRAWNCLKSALEFWWVCLEVCSSLHCWKMLEG